MAATATDSPLVDRALRLHHDLVDLRQSNADLEEKNENLVQVAKDIKKELENWKTSSAVMEKQLRGELRNLQASWDSLYEEYRAAEEKCKYKSKSKNKNKNKSKSKSKSKRNCDQEKWQARQQEQNKSQQENAEEEDDDGESLSSLSFKSFDEEKPRSQIDIISSAIEAMKKQSNPPSKTIGPTERKLQELEEENMALKSALVKLRTQYREEKYRSEHPTPVSLTSTTSLSDSDNSMEETSKKPSPLGLFVNISRQNVVGRSLLPDSSSKGNSCNNASSLSKPTRNLWGMMTSNENPISGRIPECELFEIDCTL